MIQRSCTSASAGSWYKWPKGSSHRDAEREILHKLSHRILIQRSRTSAPTGSWYSGPKDPATEILHKCSYRILIQAVQRLMHTEILKQRSCTSCLTGSWYRDLAQVVLEDPDTSGSKASWYEILCKWSYRILIQVVRILIQRSCYKCRADLLSLLVGVRSHTLFGVSCRDNFFKDDWSYKKQRTSERNFERIFVPSEAVMVSHAWDDTFVDLLLTLWGGLLTPSEVEEAWCRFCERNITSMWSFTPNSCVHKEFPSKPYSVRTTKESRSQESSGGPFWVVMDIQKPEMIVYFFPECVAKGSCLTWESECRAVFTRRCFWVRNRAHVFKSGSYGPAVGESS